MPKTSNLAQVWPVRNDQIVLLLLAGMPQKEVAAQFEMTRQMISRIANDPRAEEIIRSAREAISEKLLDGIEDELDAATRLSMKVIRRTLDADISPVHKAKANQDRVAVSVLRGRGYLSQEGRSEEGGFKVSPAQFDRLVGALAKADAAKKIDPFENIPEAEAVVVGEENE